MAIPDSNSGWSLQDVINEVSPSANNLIACFIAARLDFFFNPDYSANGAENDMLEFRDYDSYNSHLKNYISKSIFLFCRI